MRRVRLQFGGWWGIQFPSNLQSRALWDLSYTDLSVCGLGYSCGTYLAFLSFQCIGIGTRTDGPSSTLRPLEPYGPDGKALVPALMNFREPLQGPAWDNFPVFVLFLIEVGYSEPYPNTWRLSLISNVFTTTPYKRDGGQSYVDFSNCNPDEDWPELLADSLKTARLAPNNGYPPYPQFLAMSWPQGTRTIENEFDIWCEPPLYLYNTTHNYLTGNGTLCVTCPLPYVDRSPTRPDLVALRGPLDPTQFEYLEECNDICPLGTGPTYYRTGCQGCPDTSFTFGGRCESCPTERGTGRRGPSGDFCECDSGHVFQPMAPQTSIRTHVDVAPQCVVCPKDTLANPVTNLCEACPLGQGRAFSPIGSEQALSCSACPELEYNPAGGPEGCRPCPVGAVAAPLTTDPDHLGLGPVRVTCQCAPGYTFNATGGAAGRGACTLCRRRSFNPPSALDPAVGAYSTCQVCPLGTSPNEARTECLECSASSQPLAPGVCYKCAAGQEYNPVAKRCLPCKAGYISELGGDCTGCGPGQTSDSAHADCVNCPSNTFSSGPGPCRLCPPGLVPNPSQDGCLCPPGYELNSEAGRCEFAERIGPVWVPSSHLHPFPFSPLVSFSPSRLNSYVFFFLLYLLEELAFNSLQAHSRWRRHSGEYERSNSAVKR